MNLPKHRVISQQFFNQDQSWHFEQVVAAKGVKMRVYIVRNSHDFQSYARGYILDPVHYKWNTVVDRPIMGMKCRKTTYTNKDQTPHPFMEDAESVLHELMDLVDNSPPR